MLEYYTKKELIEEIAVCYALSFESYNYAVENIDLYFYWAGEVYYDTNTLADDIDILDGLKETYDWVDQQLFNWQVVRCMQDILDLFNTDLFSSIFGTIGDIFYLFSDAVYYLIGENWSYANCYNLPLYLNHYTMADVDDLMWEIKRKDYACAEMFNYILDKVNWKAGQIEFNYQKAVNPEFYIPVREFITGVEYGGE